MAFEDLLKDSSSPLDNKNYFNLTITDLNISTLFPLQFRWKYEDGSFGPWSAVKSITTPGESFPNVPSTLTVANNTPGYLQITWDGNTSTGAALTNFDRVDIYVNGAPFDSSKPATSFFSAGTKTIVAPAGTYIVSSYAVSKIGTLSAMSTAVTRTVTASVPAAESSVTPSTPTVSSVLGAIQLSWNGKTSSGGDQPYGFTAAKVYVGTSSGFTPSSLNQVDVLNFANGQNTLNIGVGTIVNGSALTYGVDYYVKIATTNGTDTSTAVSATGNPVQIGKVTSGDIVTIAADKITTGTLDSASTITVGSTSGKHVKLSGTGDPLLIYGTGGVAGGAILSFNGTKLSIVGDGTFSGSLEIGSSNSIFKADPSTGIWLGNATYASAPFSVSTNGVIKANSGTIGGWTLGSTYLQGSNFEINSSSSTIFVGPTGGQHIRISSSGGIATYNGGTQTSAFNLSTSGSLSLSGSVTASSGSIGGWTIGSTTITGGNTTLNSNGTVTTYNLDALAGNIGGWTINNSNGDRYIYYGSTYLYGSASSGSQTNASVFGQWAIVDANRRAYFYGSYAGADGVFSLGPIATGTGNISTAGGAVSVGGLTSLFSDGSIFANTLGTTTGTPNIRQAAGYLRFTSSSSQRYKNSIVNINTVDYLDPYKLLEIPVRAFKYNDGYIPDTDQRFNSFIPGLIAEEVEEFYPIAVDYNNDQPETWVPNYIIPGMLLIIKDLKSRLDALEG
jgi:hypothetical protein